MSCVQITIFDRMSAQGAHLILGARGEAVIRKGRSFERSSHQILFKKRRYTIFLAKLNSFT